MIKDEVLSFVARKWGYIVFYIFYVFVLVTLALWLWWEDLLCPEYLYVFCFVSGIYIGAKLTYSLGKYVCGHRT